MKSTEINEKSPWQDITEGNKIFEPATSRHFRTGEWRTATPVFDEENASSVCCAFRCARILPFR